ncbi:MAG TPA: hypothetical protein VIO57_14810 [Chloroflexota bacterium]
MTVQSDRQELEAEIQQTREQVAHLAGTLKRDLLPQHRAKIELQYAAACSHLDRLEKMAA